MSVDETSKFNTVSLLTYLVQQIKSLPLFAIFDYYLRFIGQVPRGFECFTAVQYISSSR